MKLHSMIIAGGAGLLLLGACSPSYNKQDAVEGIG